MGNMIDLEKETERVILVGVSVTDEDDTQKSLEELKDLASMMILKLRLLRCRFCPVFLLRMLTDHSFLYLYLLFLTAESSVTVNKRILPAFRFRYRQMFFSDTGRYFEIVFVISCSIQLNVSGVHCVCSSSIICISRSFAVFPERTA